MWTILPPPSVGASPMTAAELVFGGLICRRHRRAAAQVVRWTGAPEIAGQHFLDMVAPAQPGKPQ